VGTALEADDLTWDVGTAVGVVPALGAVVFSAHTACFVVGYGNVGYDVVAHEFFHGTGLRAVGTALFAALLRVVNGQW